MSETEGTVEATETETEKTAAEATAADEIGTDTVEEPVPGAAVSDEVANAMSEELAAEAIPVALAPVSGRQAKVYLCDRGHRTVAMWSEPTSCHARPTRSGGECGHQLYPIGELPEQEKTVITLYYAEDLLLRDIGEVLGVTESRVSQIHSRALYRLNRQLSALIGQEEV